MSSSALERAILEAITYFGIFSYPLATLEVWQNIRVRATYVEVKTALRTSAILQKKLQCAQGLWFLKNNPAQGEISGRQTRYRVSKAKLDKARRFARLLRFIPAIEAVYVCNSLGYLNTRPEGDIDIFAVAKRGRIWTARFFAILIAEFTGFRPKRAHAKDGLCLSFFAVEGARMEELAFKDDIYYVYWMSKLLPIFERNGALEKFWGRALWLRRKLPQAMMIQPPKSVIIEKTPGEEMVGRWGDFFERKLRILQLKIMPPYLKDVANKGTGVVISDEFLKFHDHDKRDHFKQEFSKRMAVARV